jgi:hypothetical protein
MTAQVSDCILIDGQLRPLFVLPLDALLRSMPDGPRFEIQTTDNCRGYVARWKIVNDRLWLAGVKGQLESEEDKSVDWSSASEREATPTKRPSWTRWLGRYSPLQKRSARWTNTGNKAVFSLMVFRITSYTARRTIELRPSGLLLPLRNRLDHGDRSRGCLQAMANRQSISMSSTKEKGRL